MRMTDNATLDETQCHRHYNLITLVLHLLSLGNKTIIALALIHIIKTISQASPLLYSSPLAIDCPEAVFFFYFSAALHCEHNTGIN